MVADFSVFFSANCDIYIKNTIIGLLLTMNGNMLGY